MTEDKWVVISDFDGIFTTPYFTYTVDGKTSKSFSPNDAHVAKALIPHLEDFQILTGETSDKGIEVTKKRLNDTGLIGRLNICPGSKKLSWIRERYDMSRVAYFGDDIFDLKIFGKCGFSACPISAMPVIKKAVQYASPQRGGEDAFADMALHFANVKLRLGPANLLNLTDI